MISDALQRVEERIERAAARARRARNQITLVGVSKVMPAAAIEEAYRAGLRNFGENYVQEFQHKSAGLGPLPGAVFHLIGHLQGNKASPAAELFHVIQTVDSIRLARRLHDTGRPLRVLIEVKLSPESAKSGVEEAGLPALVESVRSLPGLDLQGLMVMPPWPKHPEDSRPYFSRLRQLAGQNRLRELSMGMSGDFETAIEEGSTIIRIGTAIFGPRPKH